MGIKVTTESFIKDVNKKHNNFYSYDKTEYVKAHVKVVINCPIHGDFKQTPTSHKNGNGCPECGRLKSGNNRKVWTEESFRQKVVRIHPKLIFDKTVYINPRIKVKYDCPIHGEKSTYPYSLLKGHGCKNCHSSKPRLRKEDWLLRFESCGCDAIDYDKLPDYIYAEEKVSLSCSIHGDFEQTPLHHLKSCCPKCGLQNAGWTHTNWQNTAEKSKNFDSFKVYIIRCWDENEEFYKIGKTFVKLSKRFNSSQSMPYRWEVVNCYSFDSSKKASSVERYLQNINEMYKYTPLIFFDGYSECFSEVNPSYTSQQCSKCGHTTKENRKTQSLFECVSCGYTENADLQACFNILQRGQTLLGVNVGQ